LGSPALNIRGAFSVVLEVFSEVRKNEEGFMFWKYRPLWDMMGAVLVSFEQNNARRRECQTTACR
jgi:hypothetical protein